MKIQKFNESVENWTEDRLEKICSDSSDISILILDYLEMYHKNLFYDKKYKYSVSDFWFDEGEDKLFNVFCEHQGFGRDETINYEFPKEEFQDFLAFTNNTDAYKNTKKYNI